MKKLIIVLVMVLLVSAGCAKAPEPAPTITPYPAPPAPLGGPSKVVPAPTIAVAPPVTVPAPRATPAPTPTPAPASSGVTVSDQSQDIDRMIVRTGEIALVVNDIPAAMDGITRLTDTYKGYVVSSRSWREGDRLRGTISIRVPAGDFANIMKSLAELAVEVTSQSSSSKDVTEEYVDLKAKLQNLEATEQQLLKIMQQATKVEDILNVQRELTNTRGQIEQTKGRMQYLEQTSTMSLINVKPWQAR